MAPKYEHEVLASSSFRALSVIKTLRSCSVMRICMTDKNQDGKSHWVTFADVMSENVTKIEGEKKLNPCRDLELPR